MPFEVVGRAPVSKSERPAAHFQIVSPDYLKTMGINLRRGRHFAPGDTEGSPRVAIVNETFARRYIGTEDPLGQRVRIESLIPGARELGPEFDWEVVGVVESLGLGTVENLAPEIYVPQTQSPIPAGYLSLRTAVDPLQMVEAVRSAVRARRSFSQELALPWDSQGLSASRAFCAICYSE